MTRYVTIGLSMLAGAALGGAGIQAIHAQAKPPVFQVSLQQVSDAAALEKEFVPLARPTVRAHGGRTIAASIKPVAIEGAEPNFRVVINQWESLEKVREWSNSPDYQKARVVGNKYAKFQIFVVQGLPQQ
jgi:uncharacterized protein (DUF1330 family)